MMENLKAIREMNDLQPAGYWKDRTAELCARVEALEKENKALRDASENGAQALQEAHRATEAPTDEDVFAFLSERPGRSLAQICRRFGVAWGGPPNYTTEARAIRRQLQRLRLAGRIESGGRLWNVR